MDVLLTESQFKRIVQIISEEITNVDDFYEMMNETEYEVFMKLKDKKKISFKKINTEQYSRALNEFMTYGKLMRFPLRYVYEFKEICLRNIILLNTFTNIFGHSSYFPFDVFYDVFPIPEEEQNYDFSDAYEYLENHGMDEYLPVFSNGQPLLSDYGLKPLSKLATELIPITNPEEILVLINRILDVAHMRSDLSEIFIEGGQKTLTQISNS
jgi:hypothetical protein